MKSPLGKFNPISTVNYAVSVGIQKFLDDHRVSARQAGDLQRDRAAVGVADGGGRDGKDGGTRRDRAKAGIQRRHEQKASDEFH